MAKTYLKLIPQYVNFLLYVALYAIFILVRRFKTQFVAVGFLLMVSLGFLLGFYKKSPSVLLHYDQNQMVMINPDQRQFLLEKWQKIYYLQPNSQSVKEQLDVLKNQ